MKIAVLLLTTALLSAQSGTLIEATPRDVAVFRAVLQETIIPQHRVRGVDPRLVVFDRTYRFCDAQRSIWCMGKETRDHLDDWGARIPTNSDLIRSFLSRNRAEIQISNLDARGTVVVSTDALETQSDDYWVVFRTRYPGAQGWVRFSAPTYSADSEALVYVTYACGGLCGEGLLVRLVLTDATWRVTKWERVWDS